MADQSTNTIYTFEDIQRYISGKMSVTEMHALEKAALQDIFLADAIEGFTNSDASISARHINEINASLLKEAKGSLLLSLKRKTNWWRIAAIIILIFGIGVLSDYVFKRMNTQQQIAQVKTNDTNKLKSSTNGNIESDSIASQPSLISEAEQTKKPVAKSKANSSVNTKKEISDDVVMNDNNTALPRQKEILKDEADAVQMQKSNEADKNYSFTPMSAPKPDSIQQELQGKVSGIQITQIPINGKVVDNKNQPVAFASISENGTNRATSTDVNGNFKIAVTDTNNLVIASQLGYETKKIRLQEDADNKIVLNQTNSNLSDVVVVGYGVNKAKQSKTAVPVGGWNNFNNYVIEELNKDSLRVANNPTNFVEIDFFVDNNGNPYNLKITKPLDEKSNQKALDILSSGPKWITTSKQKKAKVKINF